MNWTGGRLQRHSKANANPVLRSQREHFARVRSQQPNRRREISPPRLSFFDPQEGWRPASEFDRREQEAVANSIQTGFSQETSDSVFERTRIYQSEMLDKRSQHRKRQRPSSCDRNVGKQLLREPDSIPISSPASDRTIQGVQPQSSRKFATNKPQTLREIKRSLLQRSDWMAISLVRPLQIDFPDAEEMQMIGKRRRIKQGDRAKRRDLPQYNPPPSLDQRLQYARNPARSSEVDSPYFSIRMGSKIHQSQKTDHPANLASNPASSETMLLEREDTRPDFKRPPDLPKTDELHGRQDRKIFENDHSSTNLLPLHQVLDSENFDQVKARSASLSPAKKDSKPEAFSTSWTTRRAAGRDIASSSEVPASQGLSKESIYPSSPPFQRSQKAASPVGIASSRLPAEDPSLASSNPSNGPDIEHRVPAFSKHVGKDHSGECGMQPRNTNRVSTPRLCAQKAMHGIQKDRCPTESGSVLKPRVFTIERQIEDANIIQRRIDNKVASPVAAVENVTTFSAALEARPVYMNQNDVPSQVKNLSQSISLGRAQAHGSPKGPRYFEQNSNGQMATQSSLSPISENAKFPNVGQIENLRSSPSHTIRDPMRKRLGQEIASRHQDTSSVSHEQKENERWMKFVFGPDFEKVKNRFHPVAQGSIAQNKLERPGLGKPNDIESLVEEPRWDSSEEADLASAKTIRTSANTVLHRPSLGDTSDTRIEPTETDFVSRLSPMTGYLDERLGLISNYTNPARTDRSFLPLLGSVSKDGEAQPIFRDSKRTVQEQRFQSDGDYESTGPAALFSEVPPQKVFQKHIAATLPRASRLRQGPYPLSYSVSSPVFSALHQTRQNPLYTSQVSSMGESSMARQPFNPGNRALNSIQTVQPFSQPRMRALGRAWSRTGASAQVGP